ncbi:hypothetical protein LEP1GSC041_1653 [Leptospira noguchii str. 2006001870]|nr:hypothetical protein LEP1GSC041_1653 [Leptospira noguchii str. 2006001870]
MRKGWMRGNSAQRFPELSVSLPMGRSTGRVVRSSYWYFIKIESDSGISQ